MSATVAGEIVLDPAPRPRGSGRELGGSAVYAALAAARFGPARIVGTVAGDFGDEERALLARAGIDPADVHPDPRAISRRRPRLTPQGGDSDVLLLAAMHPDSQAAVRAEWEEGRLCGLETTAHWVEHERDALVRAIEQVDVVVLDDREASRLTDAATPLAAARELVSWGPRAVAVRLGGYGCALFDEDGYFALPAYPVERVADATGAGAALAGGLLGHLGATRRPDSPEAMRRGLSYGLVLASLCAEGGARRLAALEDTEVERRASGFERMTHVAHRRRRRSNHTPSVRRYGLRWG